MWHLDYLEMPQDVTKSDRFNIEIDRQNYQTLILNTKYPDSLSRLAGCWSDSLNQNKTNFVSTSISRLVFTGGHSEKVGLYCGKVEAEIEVLIV